MGIAQITDDFNPPSQDWETVGSAGFDQGTQYSRPGKPGNAWVRATDGWNAVQNWLPVEPNTNVTVNAWLRWAPSLTGGYMSVRGQNLDGSPADVIHELRLAGDQPLPKDDQAGYFEYQLDFDSGNNRSVLLYVGMWGNGQDAWITVDSFALQWETPF